MGDKSKIEWTDATWNPTTGCTKVSAGCKHCYAERQAKRLWAAHYGPNLDGSPRTFGDVRIHPERLVLPSRWRKPRMVFVDSMSDLFHADVSDYFIGQVFEVMAKATQHTFQVLTKRPLRMHAWALANRPDPVRNVWLGVSAEDQITWDARVGYLLATPAALRFVSCEPLLGPINVARCRCPMCQTYPNLAHSSGVNWVIVGGESGPGARSMDMHDAADIVAHCKAMRVPVFVKQMSGVRPEKNIDNFPPTLRVREYPKCESRS